MGRSPRTKVEDRPVIAVGRLGLPGEGVAGLADIAELHTWAHERPPERNELLQHSSGADVIITVNGDRIDDDLMAATPTLRLVAIASAGYDTIDAAAAARRGIVVTNTPGVLHETTADTAFGLILAARRRLAEADRWVRAG